MLGLRIFATLAFGVFTVFLSFLNLGIEDGNFEASLFLERLAFGWQQVTRLILSPLSWVPIEGWHLEGWQLDALALLVFILVPYVVNFWRLRKRFALYALAYFGLYLFLFGLNSTPLDPEGPTATRSGIFKILLGLSMLTGLTLVWAYNTYLGPEVRDRDILIPLLKSWIGVFGSGLIVFVLYLSGAIEVVSLFYRIE